MELKLSVKETLDNLSSGSNRTFMELKFGDTACPGEAERLF